MKFLIYQDAILGWRWQLIAANGRIMADGGEAYIDKNNAKDAVNTIIDNIQSNHISVEERDE